MSVVGSAVIGGLATAAGGALINSLVGGNQGAGGYNQMASASDQAAADINRAQYAFWQKTYQPVETQLASEAAAAGGPAEQAKWATQAGAGVAQAYKGQTQALQRSLQAAGSAGDPSSPAYQSAMGGAALSQAGAQAGAQEQARWDAFNTGRQFRYGVGQLGRGIPSTAAQGLTQNANVAGGLYNATMQNQMAQNYLTGQAFAPFTSAVGKGIAGWMGSPGPLSSQPGGYGGVGPVQFYSGAGSGGTYTPGDYTVGPSPSTGFFSPIASSGSSGIQMAGGGEVSTHPDAAYQPGSGYGIRMAAGGGIYDPHRTYYRRGGAARHPGGHISGPGTGTSDSVPGVIDGEEPVRLSTGEHVMNAEAVKMIGRGNLDKLNEMGIARRGRKMMDGAHVATRYADGGDLGVSAELPEGLTRVTDAQTGEPVHDEVTAHDSLPFGKAHQLARSANASVFHWRGKPYTTEMAKTGPLESQVPTGFTRSFLPNGEPVHDELVADAGMSFKDAFRGAAAAGASQFLWQGKDGKWNTYTTKFKTQPKGGNVAPRGRGIAASPRSLEHPTHGDVENMMKESGQDLSRASAEEVYSKINRPVARGLARGGMVEEYGRGAPRAVPGPYRPLRSLMGDVTTGTGSAALTRDYSAGINTGGRSIYSEAAQVPDAELTGGPNRSGAAPKFADEIVSDRSRAVTRPFREPAMPGQALPEEGGGVEHLEMPEIVVEGTFGGDRGYGGTPGISIGRIRTGTGQPLSNPPAIRWDSRGRPVWDAEAAPGIRRRATSMR